MTGVESFEFADGTVSAADSLNDAPTDITSTINSVAEDAADSTVVATLTTIDVDALDSPTYALTAGDTSLFDISGGNIIVQPGATFDFETSTSHSVTVEVTDAHGATYSETIVIAVTNIDNVITGTAGVDTLAATLESDAIDGLGSTDTVSYAASATGVTVDLGANSGTGGHAQGDTFTSIENITGSAGDDTITGDTGANLLDGAGGADILTGGAGDDTIIGGAGADDLEGGADNDTVDYSGSASGVTVDLTNLGAQSGGDAAGDTLSGFENIIGTSGNDSLTGDGNDNVLTGNGGVDTFTGGAGDDLLILDDTLASMAAGSIDGGADTDTVQLETDAGFTEADLLNVLTGVEILDFTSASVTALLDLSATEIQGATDGNNILQLMVDGNDTITLEDPIANIVTTVVGSDTTYEIYDDAAHTNLEATLIVST